MRTKEEIKKMVHSAFPDESDQEKERITDHIFKNETRLEWWNQKAKEKAIEPLIPHFVRSAKVIDGASKGGKSKVKSSNQKHDYWQQTADEIWKKHPTWTKWRVSKEIEKMLSDDEEFRAKADTISRKIKKPA